MQWDHLMSGKSLQIQEHLKTQSGEETSSSRPPYSYDTVTVRTSLSCL